MTDKPQTTPEKSWHEKMREDVDKIMAQDIPDEQKSHLLGMIACEMASRFKVIL